MKQKFQMPILVNTSSDAHNIMGIYVELDRPVNGHFAYRHQRGDVYLWRASYFWCIGPEKHMGTVVCVCCTGSEHNSNTSPVGSIDWKERGYVGSQTCWRNSSIEVLIFDNTEQPSGLHCDTNGPNAELLSKNDEWKNENVFFDLCKRMVRRFENSI